MIRFVESWLTSPQQLIDYLNDSNERSLVCTYIRDNGVAGAMNTEVEKVFYFMRICKNYSKDT